MNNQLPSTLWAYFTPFLDVGIPVYFNFHRTLLEDIITKESPEFTRAEALEHFLVSARSYLSITNSRARINESVYKKNNLGDSSVILLIALQVLAVEETIKKENEFTDAAYFPKLRTLISDTLNIESSLPFDPFEFDMLWSTFKSEVQEKAPITKFLTFDIEKLGAFKNKSKPLSQALLSHKDLATLASKYYEKNLSLNSDVSVLNSCISNNLSLISSRGRNCCRNKILREHVLNQFHYFLTRVSREECIVINNIQEASLSNMVVKLSEHYDCFTDESNITVFFESDEQVVPFEQGVIHLNEFVTEKKYLLVSQYLTLLKGEFMSNAPVEVKNAYFLSLDETFIAYLEESLSAKTINFSLHGLVTGTPFKIYKISDARLEDVFIQQTRGILKKEVKKKSYDLIGGLRISEKSNIYLKGFSFTKMIIQGTSLGDDEQVEVNSIKMTFKQMLNLLNENPFDFYNVKAKDVPLNFSIVDSSNHVEELYGFNISNSKLQLSKSPISASESGLVGFRFINQIPQILITRYDLVQSFQQNPELFSPIGNRELEILINSVTRSRHLSKTQKEYFCRFLRIQKVIPKHLVHRFKDSKTA